MYNHESKLQNSMGLLRLFKVLVAKCESLVYSVCEMIQRKAKCATGYLLKGGRESRIVHFTYSPRICTKTEDIC